MNIRDIRKPFEFAGEPVDDIEFVEKMVSAIEKKNGYCPCKTEMNENTLCPCLEFRKNGICHCGLYKNNPDQQKEYLITLKSGTEISSFAFTKSDALEKYGFQESDVLSIVEK